jgi:uncharacterized protein YidB (DUF937 family)
MTWSDTLKGAVGNLVRESERGGLPDLVNSVLGAEGLQTILAKLMEAGLDQQVASWLDKSRNSIPVTQAQLRTALGAEHVQQIADALGISANAVLDALACYLPVAVEGAGPVLVPDLSAGTRN